MQQIQYNELASIISLLPNCTLIWDVPKGKAIVSNRSIAHELGYSPNDIQPENWTDYVHPDDNPYTNHHQIQLSNNEIITFEARLKHADSKWLWYSISEKVIEKSSDGDTLKSVIILTPISKISSIEESLRESNERFIALANGSFDGIAIHDKGKIIEANQGLAEMTGFEIGELIGMDGLQLIASDQRDMVMEKIISGYEKPYEAIGIRKDGTKYPLEINGKQIPYKGKTVRVTEFRNIEEKKNFEKTILESEEKYKGIIEFAVDGFIISDSKGQVINVNQRLLEITGRKMEDVEGNHISIFFLKEELEEKPLRFDLLESGKTVVNERLVLKPNGDKVYLEMHSKKMPDGTYQSIVRDISSRRMAEKALDQEQLLIHNLMENVVDQIYFKDKNSRFIRASRNVISRFGLSNQNEIIGKTDFDYFASQHAQMAYDIEQKIIETGKPIIGIEEREDWPDGTITWVSTTKAPLLDAEGNIIGTFGISRDITDNKKLQDKHRKIEERFRYVIEATNDGIWDWNLVNGKVFFSDRYFTMLGYKPGEFEPSYKSWVDLLHPDDANFNQVIIRKYLKEQDPEFNLEYRMKAKGGDWIWIHARGKIVEYDSSGKPARVVGTHMDITERKRMEEQLKESNQLLQSVLNTIPVRVFWKDKDLKFIGCNESFAKDAGFKDPSDIIGKTDFEMGWQNEAELYRADDKKIMKSGNPKLNYEEPQTTPNGDIIWLRTSKIPLRDSNGKIVGILGTYDDITESKRSRELIELERAYFEQLFESSPEGIVALGVDDRVIRCNLEFSKIFGYTQEEMAGKPINSFIVPDNLEEEGQRLTQMVASGETVVHETVRKRRDDSLVNVSILGKPIYFQGGKIAVYGIYRDISDRKLVEDELIQKSHEIEAQNEEYRIINEELYVAKQKAEESDRLKSAFLANMSHEIRTPMNGILGFFQLLANPDIPSVDVKEYVRVIHSCGNQLLGIINDLIDISKIEANQIAISDSDVNLNQIIQEQYLLFKAKAQAKGIDLIYSVDLDDEKSAIISDSGRLRQILTNLISNAIKFTQRGSVRFGYTLKGGNLQFFIKDTGIGISPEHYGSIFQRFNQVETRLTEQTGGTGLGLAISKAYINKMGGDIWVESEVGIGTTFYFSIPHRPSKSIIEQEENIARLQFDNLLEGVNLLVAEDDDVNFFYFREMFSSFDFNVFRAKNGLEAVDIVVNNPNIDIVLMDIKMPEMDGYAATTEIKRIRKSLPIIVQTAYAFSSDREKAFQAGCDEYISKPIDRLVLLNLMNKHLRR